MSSLLLVLPTLQGGPESGLTLKLSVITVAWIGDGLL